jgi:hypothetical protein
MSGIGRAIGARSSGNTAKQDANHSNKHSITKSELDDGDRGMSGTIGEQNETHRRAVESMSEEKVECSAYLCIL